MPASSSVVGKEAKKITTEFERKVLKEIQRYEHRIFQEMDPETAEQLQQSENEITRLRDTLQGESLFLSLSRPSNIYIRQYSYIYINIQLSFFFFFFFFFSITHDTRFTETN